MNLHAVRVKFIWTSYRRANEVNMLYPCNTNDVDIRLINSSPGIHMKFIWISNDLNFMWTSCEPQKNYMTSTQEIPLYYTWIWLLAYLLCTSYEWASRSIVSSTMRIAVVSCVHLSVCLSVPNGITVVTLWIGISYIGLKLIWVMHSTIK